MKTEAVSDSPLQREHEPLLRGQGHYLDDIVPARTAHVAFVRSSHAHASLGGIDVSAA